TSQIPRRTAKTTEEQLHGLHDSRVSPPDSKIGEDEEAPVRRDVFRAVQLSRGVAGGVPLASGVQIGRAACRDRVEVAAAAEDGIRDLIVTGVQTCALPI